MLTCWVVFLNTASTGEIIIKGYRRLVGTVLGVIAGVALAGLVGNHTWTAFALILLFVFAMFFTAPLSYALMSFFVTAMLGLLYTLLNTYSLDVLILRIEETALGAACGIIAAALVLPVHTDRRTDDLLGTVLTKLDEVVAASVDQLSGGPATDLLGLSRDLDTALDDLRASTRPLTHPITPCASAAKPSATWSPSWRPAPTTPAPWQPPPNSSPTAKPSPPTPAWNAWATA